MKTGKTSFLIYFFDISLSNNLESPTDSKNRLYHGSNQSKILKAKLRSYFVKP